MWDQHVHKVNKIMYLHLIFLFCSLDKSQDLRLFLFLYLFVIYSSSACCKQSYWKVCALNMFLQNVHHSGQPMPGEEQEDIVMTSTQCNVRNINCPVSGKPITELQDPVRRYDANVSFSWRKNCCVLILFVYLINYA